MDVPKKNVPIMNSPNHTCLARSELGSTKDSCVYFCLNMKNALQNKAFERNW